MFKVFIILCLFLTGCGVSTATKSITDAGVERIERAKEQIKKTDNIDVCKSTCNDALNSAKSDLQNLNLACKSEKSELQAEKNQLRMYLFLLLIALLLSIVLYLKKII